MTLTSEEIDLFNRYRNDFSKIALKSLQKVYRKYNPSESYSCMCTVVARKVKHRIFYDWYDKATA